ncbi:MAG TPA: cytochrome c oxidase assembly protein [Gammaproteobacteria bacterium]
MNLEWDWQPAVLLALILAAGAYLAGLLRMRSRRRLLDARRRAAFAAGLAAVFFALLSPLDGFADRSFSAHMLQHLMLMLLAPPLLVYARPATAWLWAFPLRGRRVLGRVWSGGFATGFRLLMHPVSVWLLSSLALVFWHLPGPYGWALEDEGIHTFEHACLFVTSLMFWSLVIEPYRRRQDYPACMLLVATFSVEMGFLGALLTFAPRPLYAFYAHAVLPWGLDPLEDQQIAGLVMWIPAGLVHVTTLATLFLGWLRQAEREAQATVSRLILPAVGGH